MATQQKQNPNWMKETVTLKLNTEINECEYCERTPNVLYVFGSSDASIPEFELCLACRNYILSNMYVMICNNKAQREKKEQERKQRSVSG